MLIHSYLRLVQCKRPWLLTKLATLLHEMVALSTSKNSCKKTHSIPILDCLRFPKVQEVAICIYFLKVLGVLQKLKKSRECPKNFLFLTWRQISPMNGPHHQEQCKQFFHNEVLHFDHGDSLVNILFTKIFCQSPMVEHISFFSFRHVPGEHIFIVNRICDVFTCMQASKASTSSTTELALSQQTREREQKRCSQPVCSWTFFPSVRHC